MRHLRESQDGFTLVEIMVAITILLVGVLGVTTMVNVSNQVSVAANSRQGATNVMRRVVETTRALPFRGLKNATLAADVQTQSPDLATTTPGIWTVARDSYVYTLEESVCRVDDDSDGYGAHDSVDPAFCADSSTTGTADDNPGDYKRVTVNATWTVHGKTRTARQVTAVPPGGTGDAPAVTTLQPRSGTAGQPLVITALTPTAYTFDATTTNRPASMSWTVDNTPNQLCPPITTTCGGSINSWFFTWNIGAPTIDTTSGSVNQNKCIAPTGSSSYVFDGTYQIGAMPLDSNGLAGTPSSTPVTINRCTPIPPPNFNATGRDKFMGSQTAIDIEWDDNPEGDVVGYKVTRGTTLTNGVQICPAVGAPLDDTLRSCIDPSPPAYGKNTPLYYGVYAYDQDTSGTVRQGAFAYMEVNAAQNSAPKAPTTLAAAASGGNVTFSWKIPSSPFDPDTGDTIDSFRVYRRAAGASGAWTYLNRVDPSVGYDSVGAFCGGVTTAGAACSFSDTATGGVTHQYMVTSVDTHLRESVYITSGAPIA